MVVLGLDLLRSFIFLGNKMNVEIPKYFSVKHYANGAVKKIQSSILPITPESQARLKICKGCDYYSENSRNADKGKEICRLCRCPVADKVKIPSEHCPLPLPHRKW